MPESRKSRFHKVCLSMTVYTVVVKHGPVGRLQPSQKLEYERNKYHRLPKILHNKSHDYL